MAVGPNIGSMQGLTLHAGYGARRIDSSSRGSHVAHVLRPPSNGSLQSLCPAKLATFSWLIQSQIVVPVLARGVMHTSTAHVPQPIPPSCPAHVVAAVNVG